MQILTPTKEKNSDVSAFLSSWSNLTMLYHYCNPITRSFIYAAGLRSGQNQASGVTTDLADCVLLLGLLQNWGLHCPEAMILQGRHLFLDPWPRTVSSSSLFAVVPIGSRKNRAVCLQPPLMMTERVSPKGTSLGCVMLSQSWAWPSHRCLGVKRKSALLLTALPCLRLPPLLRSLVLPHVHAGPHLQSHTRITAGADSVTQHVMCQKNVPQTLAHFQSFSIHHPRAPSYTEQQI